MHAGAEQRFIRVDVADAAYDSLIQQHGLDRRFARFEARAAKSASDTSSGSGPRAATRSGKLLAVFDAAELALIVVMQDAAVESEDGVGPFGGVGVDEELSRHAEMDDEKAAVETDRDELAVALDGSDAASGQGFARSRAVSRSSTRNWRNSAFRMRRTDEQGAQSADDGFDFGKLGHSSGEIH